MQSHKHTVGDIEEATGLSRRYIDKAYSQLSDVLKPHRIKGDYNRVLYDDSALVIFQRVAQLRAEEKHLPEISGIINGEYESASKPGGETHANPVVKRESDGQASLDEFQLLEELKAAHRREVLAVEQSKREALGLKDQVIETVRDQMKMLTEGKTPEQFRAEQAQQEIERQRERQELERLRSQEEERDAELERLASSSAAVEARIKARRALIEELEALEGKWGKGSRRKAIIKQLRALEAVDDA